MLKCIKKHILIHKRKKHILYLMEQHLWLIKLLGHRDEAVKLEEHHINCEARYVRRLRKL